MSLITEIVDLRNFKYKADYAPGKSACRDYGSYVINLMWLNESVKRVI